MKQLIAVVAIGLSAAAPIPGALAQATAPQLAYVQPVSPAGVMAVQQRLKQASAYAGQPDGMWGKDSGAALSRFQRTHNLQVTGQLNPATVATLGLNPADLLVSAAPGAPPLPTGTTAAAAEPLGPESVRAVQGRLRQLGFYSGLVDGIWGPAMQSSLEHFQQGRGLQATGQLNPATVTALGLDPNNLAASPPGAAPTR